MKVHDQTHPAMKKVADLIEDMTVCMITAVDEHHLASRPMSPILLDKDGALWFLTSASSMQGVRLESITAAFSNESDASYVSMEGHAYLLDDTPTKEHLWTSFAKPWFPDGPDSPDLRALKFVPRTVDFWDSPSSKVVRMFAVAASVIAGKPVGLGEHGHVALGAR